MTEGPTAHEEQNFTNLIDRMDRMASEETKIMTFKSQDNGFLKQAVLHPDDTRYNAEKVGRVNQTNVHEQYRQDGQFEPM
mmetsp:Transcript_13774/g.18797  ORF Transcript_13774/g.18797 Transcript_13774/m.18797 type:complete len:80 (+) Transcript_13774:1425-1664(+)|eukprot:CAMPEP_0185598882 /NCGR_PEP_ID=MMETSP0434-20130131/82302_1 /TAXON_ID=626734 ORGANISM="Favella taraikaensis, Strain Fe Narragansett Bay" /NCGR_SAMPLE_ID=MMETSP0434 /ASSEMBLY_ACC=CAM_ASM_000379 /LENGTH=79 /DNA_ID=CAMNT_0028228033 /DNA_START=1298 /DNA_END=1537 /DNA_ORIENTATION=-